MSNTDQQALQEIRLKSITFQLKSLEAQSEVIRLLFTEHREGVDLGLDPEAANVLSVANTLVKNAKEIVAQAEAGEKDQVAERLDKIRSKATYLTDHVKDFRRHSCQHAEEHLGEESQAGDSDTHKRAAQACYQAETNQYMTYQVQVSALTNLALEIAYFAAESVGLETEFENKYHLIRLRF